MKNSIQTALFLGLVFFCLVFAGCNPDDLPEGKAAFDVTVDVSALSLAERQSIDRVQIEIAGGVPATVLQESASFASENIYVISTDPFEVAAPTDVFVRASVYAGDFEVAGKTERIALNPGSGALEKTFKLTPRVSPNGCALTRTATTFGPTADADIGSFDVINDGTGFVLAYSQRFPKKNDVYTLKLDSQANAVAQPTRITYLDQVSVSPMIAKMLDGFALLWEFVIGDYGVNGFMLTKLDTSAKSLSGAMIVQASKAEIYPALAVSGGVGVAVGWQEVAAGGFHDELKVATLAHTGAGVYGIIDQKIMGTNTAKNIALTTRGSGYAAVWSDQSSLVFGFLDPAYNSTLQTGLRSAQGTGVRPSIVSTTNGYLVSWEDTRSSSSEIYISHVSAAGAKVTELKLADGGNAFSPKLAWNGGASAGVAFTQLRDANAGGAQLFLTQANTNGGARLGSGDLQVSHTLDRDAVNPRIVATPLGFMLFWVELKAGAPGALKHAQVQCQ